MKVAVTGGSGFLGTNVIGMLLERGREVLNLDRSRPRCKAQEPHWKDIDLLDGAALHEALAAFQPAAVVHLAARTDLVGRSERDYEANTQGVRNIIDASNRLASVERFVFASTMLVCRLGYQPKGDEDYCPGTAYGASKVRGEQMVRAQMRPAIAWTIVRPTSLWGPWFDVPYRQFFDAIRAGWFVQPRKVDVVRTFGYVSNCTWQVGKLLEAPRERVAQRTYYLGDYEPLDMRRWAEAIRAELEAPRIREVPVGLLRCAAVAGDALQRLTGRSAPLTTSRLDNLLTSAVLDLSATRDVCGELPHTMPAGVAATVAWLRANVRGYGR